MKQEETRVQTAQMNLSKEKDMMLDHIKRERADVQRAKVFLIVFNVRGIYYIYIGKIESVHDF